MRYRFLIALFCLFAVGNSAANACNDLDINDPRHPCGNWLSNDYSIALETIRASDVHDEHQGQGTTVVQIENYIPWLEAIDGGSDEALFGDCELNAGLRNAENGFAPQGDSCRVKWVQCSNLSVMRLVPGATARMPCATLVA